jgi:hypothetical protein
MTTNDDAKQAEINAALEQLAIDHMASHGGNFSDALTHTIAWARGETEDDER